MTWSVVDLGTAAATGGPFDPTILTIPAGGVPSGATLVVVLSAKYNGLSIVDSAGNSYGSPIAEVGNNNGNVNVLGGLYVFVVVSALALSAGDTIRAPAPSAVGMSAFYVTSDAGTISVDTGSLVTAYGQSSSPSVTSNAPAGSGELFIAAVAEQDYTVTGTQVSGWASPPDALSFQTGCAIAMGGFQVNSGSSAMTYAPSLSGSTRWSAAIFALAD
jgi:hypothetical protein